MQNRSNFQGTVFVTGFMASGKSTFGKHLAEKLDVEFLDLDEVIVEKEGKSINEIFNSAGEKYFRRKEREYLLNLAGDFTGVLALGGGSLQDQKVIDELKSRGILLFIEVPIQLSVERVLESVERPVLFDKEGKLKPKQALFDELKTLYSHRVKFYKQAQVSIEAQAFSNTDAMAEAAIEKINQYV
ncbi:MAG: shikimate kinase [Balneolaceae bacterium]